MVRIYVLILLLLILLITIVFMMKKTFITTDIQTVEPKLDKKQIIIGIISDTHIPTRADKIPGKVFEKFRGVDMIVHAGDVVKVSTIKELEKIAPVVAVEGNMDFDEIKDNYPKVAIIKVYSHRIGVYHGSILPWEVENTARQYDVNVLISGHIHKSSIKRKDDIIFVNPGSPTNPIFSRASIALLKVTEKSIEPELIYL
jgi:hypothetical protein